jgi:glucose-1-phosphate thymidylyltransferase
MRKGIILAGGMGSRLGPITDSISKQLLPVYDKPMIYYPISTLLLANIRDILIISTPSHMPLYQELLGDGSQWGINLTFIIQNKPSGIGEAFILGEEFIEDDDVALILGDNIFYGNDLANILAESSASKNSATIFAYNIDNPVDYGVVEISEDNIALSIEEKPSIPKSNYAVTGLYFYDSSVVSIAKSLEPSARGELEITDINNVFLEKNDLNVEVFGRGIAWLDTGTPQNLIEAGQFISTIQRRQGLLVACPEEIAYTKGYISHQDLEKIASKYASSDYSKYIKKLLLT